MSATFFLLIGDLREKVDAGIGRLAQTSIECAPVKISGEYEAKSSVGAHMQTPAAFGGRRSLSRHTFTARARRQIKCG
jgi:hypothetical protein